MTDIGWCVIAIHLVGNIKKGDLKAIGVGIGAESRSPCCKGGGGGVGIGALSL